VQCRFFVVAIWVSGASASPLHVRTSNDLPFSAAELDAALSVRTVLARPGARSIEATVSPSDRGVHIVVAGRELELGLDGVRGVEAARLVAFAILDAASDQLDPPAGTLPERAAAPPTAALDRAVEEPATDHSPLVSLALWGHGGSRNEGELEVGARLAAGVRAIVAGGVSTRDTLGGMVTARAWPARAGLAWRGPHLARGELEARVTAVAVFEQAQAAIARTDPMFGAGAAVAWAAPLAGTRAGMTLFVGGGVDGYVTELDYRVDGTPQATTSRATWWTGIGLGAELWQ
jgi:hypothetical protein